MRTIFRDPDSLIKTSGSQLSIKKSNFLFFILLMLIFAGCTKTSTLLPEFTQPAQDPTLTLTAEASNTIKETIVSIPSMTVTDSPDETKTPAPKSTKTILAPTIDPTYFIFPSSTATMAVALDEFQLKLVAPGPMSKVVSPIEMIVHIAPEYTGTTHIELIGENGQKLYRKIFKTYSNIGYYTRVAEKIEYEIAGAAEIARLQISTYDSSGNMKSLNSVRLLLQSVGENVFTPADSELERLFLRNPIFGAEVKSGNLLVSGEYRPVNNLPTVLELIDSEGKVLGSRIINLDEGIGAYQLFDTSVQFSVKKKTIARILIRQSDDRIDGLAYLFSREIVLLP